MDRDKILRDMTSKKAQLIRTAGAEIIRNSQNEISIESLIPFLNKIKRETSGLELGGAFASNNRFYKFPIQIIEFHKRRKSFWSLKNKCTCNLYLSKSYLGFNPDKEAEGDTIQLIHKMKGNWTQDYIMQCLKCFEKYYVSERHYHYMWWHWEPLRFERQIMLSGNAPIDDEFQLLIKAIEQAIKVNNISKNSLIFESERLINHRTKLSDKVDTKDYEFRYGWNIIMDEILKEINQKIKNKG